MLDDSFRDACLPHLGSPAVQETRIQIGEGASLEYLPDHVIPYRDSKFRQSLRVEMSRGSRAIFWDTGSGSRGTGRAMEFRELDSDTEISLRGRPVFLNRTRIRPSSLDPQRLGFAEGFNYLATLIIVADGLDGWKEAVAEMNAELRKMPAVYGGGSVLASGRMRRQIADPLGFRPGGCASSAMGPRPPDRSRISCP